MASMYELKANAISGEEIALSQFEGQLSLVVNVASQ
jgi:glutathione peroxidase-family protein